MRFGVTGLSAIAAILLAIGIGRAQAPPPGPPPLPAPGFVSTYEIVRTLRAAGFDPMAPPLREGTIYVARATDYRGILMRVVLDARTGAIRDANRIVPGPGNYGGPYGPYGEAEDPYGGPVYGPGPYGPGPYGSPGPYGPDVDAYDPDGDSSVGAIPPADDRPIATQPPGAAPLPRGRAPTGASGPPLPRPRPPELAARQPAGAKPAAPSGPKPVVANDPKSDVTKSGVTKPAVTKPDLTSNGPPPAPAAPRQAPSTLTINN